MAKELEIEDVLCPGRDTLNITIDEDKEMHITATIVDVELDPVKCTFMGDQYVELNVEGYEYLQLDINTLEKLISLIREADSKYNEYYG